jgi:hypothetical protein
MSPGVTAGVFVFAARLTGATAAVRVGDDCVGV